MGKALLQQIIDLAKQENRLEVNFNPFFDKKTKESPTPISRLNQALGNATDDQRISLVLKLFRVWVNEKSNISTDDVVEQIFGSILEATGPNLVLLQETLTENNMQLTFLHAMPRHNKKLFLIDEYVWLAKISGETKAVANIRQMLFEEKIFSADIFLNDGHENLLYFQT